MFNNHHFYLLATGFFKIQLRKTRSPLCHEQGQFSDRDEIIALFLKRKRRLQRPVFILVLCENGVFIDVYGYLLVFIDVYGYLLVLIDVY